jgi:hypothetical protein
MEPHNALGPGSANDTGSKRFFRQLEDDFGICVNIGKKGTVYVEDFYYKNSAFFYQLHGKAKIGKLFDPNFRIQSQYEMWDYQNYWDDDESHPGFVIEAIEDFHAIGFNVFDNTLRWESKLLTAEDKTISMPYEKNVLICLDGNPIIEGNTLKRYDYIKLEPNQEYVVNEWNDSQVAIFSVVGPR